MAIPPLNGWARDEAVRNAEAILSGQLGILEGCIPMASLAHDLCANWASDPDFVVFGAIASEIDNLPFGVARDQWSRDALAKADLQIQRYTQESEAQVLAACRNVIERFKEPGA
jgi:hypothetical protein